MADSQGRQARVWWKKQPAKVAAIPRSHVILAGILAWLLAGAIVCSVPAGAAQAGSQDATKAEQTGDGVKLEEGLPWQDIHSLEDLEGHLERAARSLRDETLIRTYLKNSGLKVSRTIPISLVVMRHRGFNEPGLSIQSTKKPSEIEGPLGRWYNWYKRAFAAGLFISVSTTQSGELSRVQAGFNYE